MAIGKKTCFVISPIGEDGSDVRRNADDLLELVLVPALEKFKFELIRADKIPRPGVITSEIVHLVQNADLCIVDLTGHNPNVYYECGRRHETGKPFIQVIRKGERLPFDVAGIRTIFYDLATPRTTHDSVREIQKYVEEFEKQGYSPSPSGASLSTIASAIERIERRLASAQTIAGGGQSYAPGDPFAGMGNLRERFMEAIAVGNTQLAATLLPRLSELLGAQNKEYAAAAAYLAVAGHEAGALALLDVLRNERANISDDALKSAIGGLVRYYEVTDREKEGIEVLLPIIDEACSVRGFEREDEAYLINQKQKLLYGAGDYEGALAAGLRAHELLPTDLAYMFNLSLIYEKLGQPRKAVEFVDRYMTAQNDDHDPAHYAHAVDLYAEAGRDDDMRRAFGMLREANPNKAALLYMRLDRDTRKRLSGGQQ